MKIMLPKIDPVDLSNPPEDLDEKVRESFKSFTSGTNHEYIDDDKLYYIDRIRNELSPNYDAHKAVVDAVMQQQRYHFEETGEFMDEDEFYDIGFMEDMYELGISDTNLYGKRGNSGSDAKQINSTLARIIRVVMNYGV